VERKEGAREMLADGLTRVQGWGITVLRVVVGIVFLVHGTQKLFGFGFDGVAEGFERLGIPLPLFFAVVVTLVEFLGGVALILGLLTRFVSISLAIAMLVATLLVYFPNGFFSMNGGYEYTLVLIAATAALILERSGEAALGRVLAAHGRLAPVRLLRLKASNPR
jgi:putative oxidoreductase